MDWRTGSSKGQFSINWLSNGVETDNENPIKPYFRHGQAVIAINGNPITILERYTEDVVWDIYLIGARSFYSEIQIGFPITSRNLGEFKFDEYLQSQNIPYRQVRGFNEEFTSAIKVMQLNSRVNKRLSLIMS